MEQLQSDNLTEFSGLKKKKKQVSFFSAVMSHQHIGGELSLLLLRNSEIVHRADSVPIAGWGQGIKKSPSFIVGAKTYQ